MAPYPAYKVGNSFLVLAWEDGKDITPMKLQKLVYIAHGWHLAIYGQELVEESVQAWQYGPVLGGLYKLTKHFGGNPIDELIIPSLLADEELELEELLVPEEDELVWTLLDRVWAQYGGFKAMDLSSITHEVNTPWDITRKQVLGSSGYAVIDNNLIRQHYLELGRKNNAAT